MLKALTFIGSSRNKYSQTTYYIDRDGKREYCKTHLFPEVVVELYKPKKLIAFATDEVLKDIHGHGYVTHLCSVCRAHGVDFDPLRIPSGKSTTELWDIFDVYANAVDDGDKIVLDITHGFRSLPVLALPAITYLRQVKNAVFEHILYGAFEAPDSAGTPIFDLTPFVSLLNWTNAVNIFQRTGDARPIADLDIHSDISDALTKLSESLLTNRTIEVQEAAFRFNGLPISTLVTSAGNQAPFRMLIQQLQANYRCMAVNDPHSNPKSSIKKQYEQLKWYIDNQHYLQAITLIREWLVSWEYIRQHPTDPSHWRASRNHRKPIEDAFNNKNSSAADPDEWAWDLWDACADLRNDLAHCGMRIRPAPRSAEEAIEQIKELFEDLEKFARAKKVI